jgi:hypothetical protein
MFLMPNAIRDRKLEIILAVLLHQSHSVVLKIGLVLLQPLFELLVFFDEVLNLLLHVTPFLLALFAAQPSALAVLEQTVLFWREKLAHADQLLLWYTIDVNGKVGNNYDVGVVVVDIGLFLAFACWIVVGYAVRQVSQKLWWEATNHLALALNDVRLLVLLEIRLLGIAPIFIARAEWLTGGMLTAKHEIFLHVDDILWLLHVNRLRARQISIIIKRIVSNGLTRNLKAILNRLLVNRRFDLRFISLAGIFTSLFLVIGGHSKIFVLHFKFLSLILC